MSTSTAVESAVQTTECLTFPRSGHGLLHRLLDAYFGPELGYCEYYHEPEKRLDSDPTTRFQKDHDFELRTPVDPSRRYVVQVRYPVESIVSWYKLQLDQGGVKHTPGAWQTFAIEKAGFWCKFYRKWVLSPIPNRIILNYADLVLQPERELARVVRFVSGAAPDPERIASACANEPIRRLSRVRQFEFYGPLFFDLLSSLFASTPGICIETETLTIPVRSQDQDPAPSAIIAAQARQIARQLDGFASSLQRFEVNAGAGLAIGS